MWGVMRKANESFAFKIDASTVDDATDTKNSLLIGAPPDNTCEKNIAEVCCTALTETSGTRLQHRLLHGRRKKESRPPLRHRERRTVRKK